MALLYLAAAWLTGIAIAKSVSAAWWVWLLFGLGAGAGLLLWRREQWWTGFGCVLLCALGAARYSSAIPSPGEANLSAYNGIGFVTLTGFISEAPDVRDTQVLLTVKAESLTLPGGETRSTTGLVLVQAPRTKTYQYGDPVTATGELREPPSEEEGFSYRDWLARKGIYSLMQYAQVSVSGERQGSPIRARLLDFRAYAHQTIQRLLPDPESSLLAGIILGIESGIAPEVRDAFATTGTAHIIAISGANLAILGGLLINATRRFLPQTGSIAVTITGIVLYSIFVGGDPAVLRAAVMTTLGLVATLLGRQTYGLASLGFAALLLTAINPMLLWDVGFQLSFMATLGLILYSEPIQRMVGAGLQRLLSAETAQKIVGALSDALLVTIAAQLTTAPIMAYYFKSFSIVSLPVNLLIVPVQPLIMILGGLGTLLAMIVWPVGQLLAWGSWLLLSYTIGVVEFGASLPFASTSVETLSAGAVFALYAAMFGITWLRLQPETDRQRWLTSAFGTAGIKVGALSGILIASLLGSAAVSMPDGKLHITFLDLGEGSATLIETPSGRHILVDGGGSGRALSAALGDELPFWKRTIDVLIVTQPSQPHLSALLPVVERYKIQAVISNGAHGGSELASVIWTNFQAQGTSEVIAQPGMQIVIDDGVTLTILAPAGHVPDNLSDPGQPVVVMLTYGDARILLAGDIDQAEEMRLLASTYPLSATILQIPAGGHRDGSSEPFLNAVNPQVSVIAVGAESRAGLPHTETLERLQGMRSLLYRTDLQGDVQITTDGSFLWIQTERTN